MSEEQRAGDEAVKAAKARQMEAMTEQELVTDLISAKPYIPPAEVEAEIKVRQIRATKELTAALVAFKDASVTASTRLENLTNWLTRFTIGLVVLAFVTLVLTGIVAWHDLTR